MLKFKLPLFIPIFGFNFGNSSMATYESLIKIKGAVGDLVFYNLNGKNVVRKKSGFNKTAFKKNASYEKVRQNSSEFGHCSKVGKIIRAGLTAYIKEAGDPLLYQKFAKVMTEIKDLDILSERGKRTVKEGLKTEEGKALLRGFPFGKTKKLLVKVQDYTLFPDESSASYMADILTIRLDFEHYTAEYAEEHIILENKQKISFKKQFSEDDFLICFVALKKEDHTITHMGFV
ncbi:hypothetical protein [Chryseobacterium sp. Bi04]|uniref:hypothetical protein n=1 Tax=Chryseobacterium sp. Bi04 TaxID=2822345 RepID=UPI001D405581|nr:hypothetical protein [Chryseobacterium sp. Bi04]CAH0204981.1 hypothetical protein SRABI04_02078 [Chryseobacterium sp. Bi04]